MMTPVVVRQQLAVNERLMREKMREQEAAFEQQRQEMLLEQERMAEE